MGLTFNDLPEELLVIIFLLHPIKTLVLFRSVCTLWDRIITRKYFLQLFLSRLRTSSNPHKHFLFQNGNKSIILMDIQTRNYHNTFAGKDYECYGICDGLFCLSSTQDLSKPHSKILLWTPIFRRKLPTLKIKFSQHANLVFGYHNGDYKVLKFLFFPRMFYVCIYSLSTDEWKILKYDFISSTFNRSYSKARLVNGSAYIVKDSRKSDRGIISFDLSCEIFRETKLPEDIWYTDEFILEEYRESLALIGRVSKENEIVVVIWVLNVSDDNSFSWDEMSVIKPGIRHVSFPRGFINNDELVVWGASCCTPSSSCWTPSSGFLYNVKNECQQMCISDTHATMVKTSRNVTSSHCVRVVAKLADDNELTMYMIRDTYYSYWDWDRKDMKEVALTSTSNKYNVLSDSDDDL